MSTPHQAMKAAALAAFFAPSIAVAGATWAPDDDDSPVHVEGAALIVGLALLAWALFHWKSTSIFLGPVIALIGAPLVYSFTGSAVAALALAAAVLWAVWRT